MCCTVDWMGCQLQSRKLQGGKLIRRIKHSLTCSTVRTGTVPPLSVRELLSQNNLVSKYSTELYCCTYYIQYYVRLVPVKNPVGPTTVHNSSLQYARV